MNDAPFHLRALGCGARLGLSGLVLVLAGGVLASVVFIYTHLHNRDGQPRLTMTDIVGAYHGAIAQAPIAGMLEDGHPPNLAEKDREALLDWLLGTKDAQGNRPPAGNPHVFEGYDNIDAGDANPLDIVARACLSCHSRKPTTTVAGSERAAQFPMDQWEDVKKLATSVAVTPTSTTGLLISTHAHALAMGSVGVVTGLLLVATRFPRRLVNLLFLLMGVGLAADVGGWWLARPYVEAVYLLMVGGGAFCGATGLSLFLILLDLWLPRRP